jgi:hypothetical protein
MSAGFSSSEFLKALLGFISGLVCLWIGAKTGDKMMIEAGAGMAAASNIAYIISRGLAKFGTGGQPTQAPAAPLTPAEAAKVIENVK